VLNSKAVTISNALPMSGSLVGNLYGYIITMMVNKNMQDHDVNETNDSKDTWINDIKKTCDIAFKNKF
jgi:hypothetical protein